MRLLGKDLLKQKLDKNAKSYWIERSEPMGSMKNQNYEEKYELD